MHTKAGRLTILVLLLGVSFITGCASTLETRVSTFRDESAVLGQGTIKVVPDSKLALNGKVAPEGEKVVPEGEEIPEDKVAPEHNELADSLEFSHYRKKLEQRLASIGYTPVEDDAQYIAELGYWVEEREVPDKGPRTSIGTSIGTVFGGRVGVGTGITLGGGSGTETEYYRVVTITIEQNGPRPRDGKARQQASHLIEIRATSAGSCGKLPVVFDQMLDAVFTDFTRPSGSTEVVEVPADSDC